MIKGSFPQSLLSSTNAFLIVHSPLIFVCVGCPRLVLNQRFYNGLFTACFWMHHLVSKMTKKTPQPTFLNDVYTTYLCIRMILPCVCMTVPKPATIPLCKSLISSAPGNLNETRNTSSPGFFLNILNSVFESINMGLDHKLFLQLFVIGFCLFCSRIGKI